MGRLITSTIPRVSLAAVSRLRERCSLTALLAVISGLLFAASSIVSDGFTAAALCTAAATLLVYLAKQSRFLAFDLFCWGLAFHLPAFRWLPDTLQLFGGFPYAIAFALFVLFVLISSVQFLLCGWLTTRISSVLPAMALPLAWSATEFVVPRLFPWSIVHPLIAVKPLSLLAAFFGIAPLAFLFLGFVSFVLSLRAPIIRLRNGAAVLVLLCFVGVSTRYRFALTEKLDSSPEVKVGVIQGNLSAVEKRDVRAFSANIERYRSLSTEAVEHGAELIVWPETVVSVWTPETIQSVAGTKYEPARDLGVPIIYGTLSYRPRPPEDLERFSRAVDAETYEALRYLKFNSSFGVDAQGRVTGRYHKRVLMPFGEYLPFSETFPSVKSLSPHSGDFASGGISVPITIALPGETSAEREIRAGMLICYEDLVPSLSRAEASAGANLLLNLTNDAWYGTSSAPYQHHLLASWRAIETGRFLIRATNTGVTGIVSPLGDTTVALPIFEEGRILETVGLLDDETVYAQIGDTVSWVLLLCSIGALFAARNSKRTGN